MWVYFLISPIQRGDQTSAEAYLTVLPRGMECVVFSIDGSFAASVSIMGSDPKVRPGAVDVVRWLLVGSKRRSGLWYKTLCDTRLAAILLRPLLTGRGALSTWPRPRQACMIPACILNSVYFTIKIKKLPLRDYYEEPFDLQLNK